MKKKQDGKNVITRIPSKINGEIIVIAHCCCAHSTKTAGGKKTSSC
jgi:hypothetical protein